MPQVKAIMRRGNVQAGAMTQHANWKFLRAEEFFFVCELSARTNKKRQSKIALRAENST